MTRIKFFTRYLLVMAHNALVNIVVVGAVIGALLVTCAIMATGLFIGFKLALMFPGAFLVFQAIVYGTGIPCFIAFAGLFWNEVFLGNKKYTK